MRAFVSRHSGVIFPVALFFGLIALALLLHHFFPNLEEYA